MTAEAIVMNKSAVALAADSAVTINGRGRFKTYDTVNKLFELIKGSNVGVMVYNNAALNGTPWETLIKTYRRDNSSFSASHVEDYFEHFVSYLADTTTLLAPADEEYAALSLIQHQVEDVKAKLFNRIDDWVTSAGRVVKTKLHVAVVNICDEWEQSINAADELETTKSIPSGTIEKQFQSISLTFTERAMQEVQLEKRDLRRIAKLACASLIKDVENPNDSGLVLAGFGTQDYFPRHVTATISARLHGEVLRTPARKVQISMKQPGHFETFAQDGPAMGWVNGINSEMRGVISAHWIDWVTQSLPKQLGKGLSKGTLTAAQVKDAASTMLKLAHDQLNTFFQHMDEYEQRNFHNPMLASISALPKDELGLLAESLVNITSLKQRMSIFHANTVGGPIDVALISPGDGFVWLQRKHYFDAELNPTWNLTHGARISVTEDGEGSR